MRIWKAAGANAEYALAYGFVSHNQPWGADLTAHVSGRTFGQDGGHIITKAGMLLNSPFAPGDPGRTFDDVFANLGMSQYLRESVAHLITEYAIDIRLRNDADPLLGRKLATAARSETKRFAALLIKAFGTDYAAYCFGGHELTATNVLSAAEKEHRRNMIFLGQAISQSEPVAVQLLAEQVVGLLPDFLGDLPIPEAQAVEIVKTAIFKCMDICDDYMAEIGATIEFVDKNPKDHGIILLRHANPKDRQ